MHINKHSWLRYQTRQTESIWIESNPNTHKSETLTKAPDKAPITTLATVPTKSSILAWIVAHIPLLTSHMSIKMYLSFTILLFFVWFALTLLIPKGGKYDKDNQTLLINVYCIKSIYCITKVMKLTLYSSAWYIWNK